MKRKNQKGGNEQLNKQLLEAIENVDVASVKDLLEKGADVNTTDKYGRTLLRIAVDEDENATEIVKALLEKGAKPDEVRDTNMTTPLQIAAEIGNVEIVKALLDAGADVYVRNNHDKTPLDLAEDEGHQEIAEIIKAHMEQKKLEQETAKKLETQHGLPEKLLTDYVGGKRKSKKSKKSKAKKPSQKRVTRKNKKTKK
jgi:ankyrin repeat protein